MEYLPNEILVQVFAYLPVDDMIQSSRVCKRWWKIFQQKDLWKQKEWRTPSVARMREVLVAGSGMPQLEEVQLLYGGEYAIQIAWPKVILQLYDGAPFLGDPNFHIFETECLVVSYIVAECVSGYIKCVKKRILRKLCIAEQHLGHSYPKKCLYVPYSPSSSQYSCPIQGYSYASLAHSTLQCRQQDSFHCNNDSSPPDISFLFQQQSTSETSDINMVVNETEDALGKFQWCPLLEVLNIHCRQLSQQCMRELCSLGPLRVLRIESNKLWDISALQCCSSHLEELTFTDCTMLQHNWSRELLTLKQLRVLSLTKWSLDESSLSNLSNLVASLPHLESISLNGYEIS